MTEKTATITKHDWVKTEDSRRADRTFSQRMLKKKLNKKPYIPYQEQLSDPRWIEKRDAILMRDGFICQGKNCDNSLDGETPPLHVHHRFYLKGLYAWEYPEDYLVSLCPECHSVETDLYRGSMRLLKDAISARGLYCEDIHRLAYDLLSGKIKV